MRTCQNPNSQKKELIAEDYSVWQEGAGSLLLLGAAQASGLLAVLPQIIPANTPEMSDRLAQSQTNSRQQLLQTLLFMPAVNVYRCYEGCV